MKVQRHFKQSNLTIPFALLTAFLIGFVVSNIVNTALATPHNPAVMQVFDTTGQASENLTLANNPQCN